MWCIIKLHLKTLCTREINTSCSQSGCQGLERHRKLLPGDIHKGHAGSLVSSVSNPPINSCKNSLYGNRAEESFWLISRPEWKPELSYILQASVCVCVRWRQTGIFQQEDLEYICCSEKDLANVRVNILNTRIEGGEYFTYFTLMQIFCFSFFFLFTDLTCTSRILINSLPETLVLYKTSIIFT